MLMANRSHDHGGDLGVMMEYDGLMQQQAHGCNDLGITCHCKPPTLTILDGQKHRDFHGKHTHMI